MNIEQALRYHAQKYPKMRPTDVVKLLYQSEFGGGHLIENPKRSLEWLESEYASTPHDTAIPACVPVGNGIIRVNLAALDVEVMPMERFNDIFVKSAEQIHGNEDSFRLKLSELIRLTDEGIFAFTQSELDEYLKKYAERGFPAVTHSPEFREAYHPAYRVVIEKLFTE